MIAPNTAARESLRGSPSQEICCGVTIVNTKLNIALALALLPALAIAAEPVEPHIVGKAPTPSVVVRYGDLDLSTPKGTQALEARLQDAARKVCGQVLDRTVTIEGEKCRHELVDDAEQRVFSR